MWRQKALSFACGALRNGMLQSCRGVSSRVPSIATDAVNSIILRSLKDHFVEISKMTPPPKISPPAPFTVVKGALDSEGPVLKGMFKDEEISLSVMRMMDMVPGGSEDDIDDNLNQLFIHVCISKPGQIDSLQFLCGLYPDALGINSVSLRPKEDSSSSQFIEIPTKYTGPLFEDIDEKLRDAFHGYIEERGINEKLFPFLQAWLYVKDHRNLMRWFKSVGTFVNENETKQEALSA